MFYTFVLNSKSKQQNVCNRSSLLVQRQHSVCQSPLCYFLLAWLVDRTCWFWLLHSLNPVGSECGNIQDILPPVDLHPPAATPLQQPIHFNPELMDCACLTD